MSNHTVQYPELTPELQKGFSWRSLKYFGAGAIIASVTIGSGETLFASRGGAVFGYALLWCFIGGSIMKGIQVYSSARYMTLTGVHPITHWAFLPGPRGWVPFFFGVISLGCFPFWLAGLPLMMGTAINWIFGISGDDPEKFLFYARCWGTVCIVVAVTLTSVQSYGALEKAQTAIVGILLFSMLAACFASQPDWLAALSGTFMPNLPDYAPWIVEKYPTVAARPSWVEVGIYLGAIGGGSYDYIGYLGCFREKSWGLLGRNNNGDVAAAIARSSVNLPEPGLSIDTSKDNLRRGRTWLIPPQVDVGAGFISVTLFTICFVLLGASLLHPEQLIPAGQELLTYQARFLTQFHPSFLYLYQIGIFMAFFGTIYGAYEIYLRTAYECWMPLSSKLRAMPVRRFRLGILAYCGFGGLIVMWLFEDPLKIVTPAAIVGGVLTCGLWCFAMIWIDRKFLPKELRMRGVLLILTWISGIAMTALGVQSLWTYVKGLLA